MKTNFLLIGSIALFVTSAIYVSMVFVPPQSDKAAEIVPPSFAVVELFTSEGCSSCPSADELLGKLLSEYKENALPVYFLAYHVDYWNYLGWKDDYSKKEYTQRQSRYGETFALQSVYTPQMIVNGSTEFVGSNRSRAETAVKSALSRQAEVRIDLKGCFIINDSTVKVIYAVDNFFADMVLNFAVVERGLSREIRRGENAGRTLKHHNVVRAFQNTQVKNQSEMTLIVPPEMVVKNASLIVFAQHSSSMEIVGAAELEISGI
ncbi:DUF1223 domain-containing protein [bacterium]|nr:DUF1223 domain-containing protein [bacterium]